MMAQAFKGERGSLSYKAANKISTHFYFPANAPVFMHNWIFPNASCARHIFNRGSTLLNRKVENVYSGTGDILFGKIGAAITTGAKSFILFL